jgi:hypothetical protein
MCSKVFKRNVRFYTPLTVENSFAKREKAKPAAALPAY